ncbi:MAG: hypothetical protein ACOYJX_05105 [Acutalibacteraceae bacterium]|jgi:hypothetical protein
MENSTQKLCAKCGTLLTSEAIFCSSCGTQCDVQNTPTPIPIQQYNLSIKHANLELANKVDIKRTIISNIVPIGCSILGIALFVTGLFVSIPNDYINSYSMKEYVGGDAYNFIIEASIRGGKIAGAFAQKAIYIGVGLLITCLSALKVNIVKPEQKEGE